MSQENRERKGTLKPPEWAIRTAADLEAIEFGCWWDARRANAIVKFAEAVFRPSYVGGTFRLLPWQRRLLMSLEGWRLPDCSRRFRFANIHCSKKNGKTLIIAVLCLFNLFASGEPQPYVAAAAASKANAKQVFKEIVNSVEESGLGGCCQFKIGDAEIRVPELKALFKCFAADGSRVHGEPCSLIVIDEAHAHKSPELFEALRYNIDARPNGMCVLISTAGEVGHWYQEIYHKSKRILSGEDLDILHYAEVWEADQDADPMNVEQWYKANPSLGTSFSETQFKLELLSAKESPRQWRSFRKLKLNYWLSTPLDAYLELADWESQTLEESEETDFG